MYSNAIRLTKYEKAKIIGQRATQIENGAPLTIDNIPENIKSPNDIALLEFENGNIPYAIRRKLPDGSYIDVKLSDFNKNNEIFGNKSQKEPEYTFGFADTNTNNDLINQTGCTDNDLINQTMTPKIV